MSERQILPSPTDVSRAVLAAGQDAVDTPDGKTPATAGKGTDAKATAPARPGSRSAAGTLLRAARPRQWTKNVLVAAAPAAAGVLFEPAVSWRVAVGFVVFCLAASGAYYINDAIDADADRHHPRKRHRPVAAGLITVPAAVVVGAVLIAAAVALSATVGSLAFTVAVALYAALTVTYSWRLKHMPVVDIAVVASGFIIRAVAGGLATDLPLSGWFLIVASFGALFVVTGKRHCEVMRLGDNGEVHRVTLAAYTPTFTQHLLTVSSGITMVAYCLWAFEGQPQGAGQHLLMLSILPFVMILLRYAMIVFAGRGGEPEEVVLHDRELQILGVVWAVLVGFGIHVS